MLKNQTTFIHWHDNNINKDTFPSMPVRPRGAPRPFFGHERRKTPLGRHGSRQGGVEVVSYGRWRSKATLGSHPRGEGGLNGGGEGSSRFPSRFTYREGGTKQRPSGRLCRRGKQHHASAVEVVDGRESYVSCFFFRESYVSSLLRDIGSSRL